MQIATFTGDFVGESSYNAVSKAIHKVYINSWAFICILTPLYSLLSLLPVSQDRLPELRMNLPDGTPAGEIIVDSDKMTFSGLGDSLKWARWPLLIISGPLVPYATWVAMTDTTGGAPPTAESCQGQPWVPVPYEATYTYWSC